MKTNRNPRLILVTAAALALSLAASSAPAATLVHYTFNSAVTPFADVIGTSGLTVTDLLRGAKLDTDDARSTSTTPADGGAASYFARGASLNQASGVTTTAFTSAQSQGGYLTFTMSVPTGYQLSLTQLGFDAARNTGNPHDMRILVTADVTGDNFNSRLDINETTTGVNSLVDVLQSNLSEISVAPAGLGSNWGVADNTVAALGPAFTDITSVTFRIYAFTINNTSPDVNNIMRFDNIFVAGSILAVPAPAALPAGLALLGLLTVRRRNAH